MAPPPAKVRYSANAPFPALVTGTGPIAINKVNGIWTVAFQMAPLAQQIPPFSDATHSFFTAWNSTSNAFSKVALSDVLSQVTATATGIYESRVVAAASNVPSNLSFIQTQGYYLAGDGGHALYNKTGGSTFGGFQSADGQWWQLVVHPVVNIKQFGAKGDGVTDDSGAFGTFRSRFTGQKVTLWLPPGTYKQDFGNPWLGIKSLTVWAYGATLTGDMFLFGSDGMYSDNLHDARFVTNVIGDTTITLVTTAQISRFSVGSWVYIGAIDLQGFGYPANHHLFEFQQIKSINVVAGSMTFYEPLRNAYKSTFPLYTSGDASNPDLGGPATVYALDPVWDGERIFYGLRVDVANGITCNMRKTVFVDCSWSDQMPFPSQSKEWIAERTDFSGSGLLEVDKMIEILKFVDCRFDTISFQSSSIDTCIMDGCFVGVQIEGTPKHLVIRNSKVTGSGIQYGALFYGCTESVVIDNCEIDGYDGSISSAVSLATFTNSHGTLSIASVGINNMPWAVPGAKGFALSDADDNFGIPFEVLDVRQPGGAGNPVLVDTTLPAPIPAIAVAAGTLDRLAVNPVANLTVINSGGGVSGNTKSWSQAGPAERPFVSKSSIMLRGNFGAALAIRAWGYLKKITVNVIKAYTGVASATATMHLGTAGTGMIFLTAANTQHNYDPTFDLKTAGLRTIMPNGSIGAVGADVLGSIGLEWSIRQFQPTLVENLTDTAEFLPIVEITVECTQGITHPGDYQITDALSVSYIARVANDFSKTSSAALSAVPGLSIRLPVGKYQVAAVLYCTDAATGGVKAALDGSGGLAVANLIYDGYIVDQNTILGNARGTALGNTVASATTVGTTPRIEISGLIEVSTDGNLIVTFAQNTSDITASKVLRGSYLLARPVQ